MSFQIQLECYSIILYIILLLFKNDIRQRTEVLCTIFKCETVNIYHKLLLRLNTVYKIKHICICYKHIE